MENKLFLVSVYSGLNHEIFRAVVLASSSEEAEEKVRNSLHSESLYRMSVSNYNSDIFFY